MRTVLLGLLAVGVAFAQSEPVKVTQGEGKIAVEIGGKPFGDFLIDADSWKPYLWPMRSASGKIVVRQYPNVPGVEGEAKDHPHHRGLWWAHGDVNGVDFWSTDIMNRRNPKLGKIVLVKVLGVKSGKKLGSLKAEFEWKSPAGETLLTETRSMAFSGDATLRIVDVDLTLVAAKKVVFGDTKEGTFGIRVAAPLQEQKGTGRMVIADGSSGEKQVWGKPSPWLDYAGTLDGEQLGIAVFDHPGNPRHPVRWHTRAYGLLAANPFGLKEFINDKSKDASMTVEPGQKLRYRYRVVIHPGDAQSAGIDAMYKKWAR